MIDSYKYQGLRKKLVEELVKKGIESKAVLQVIESIPRHFYVLKGFEEQAYLDKALAIDVGQTISQPFTVAYQTELLELKKGEKVLEIGTGSGYQTSVLSALGCKVFTIERQKVLFEKTKKLLETLNIRAKTFYGDGYKGLPAYAPFDKIIVTAGAPYVPKELLEQLKIGGIMIIPVGDESQVMTKIVKKTGTEYASEQLGNFKFVPLLENKSDYIKN